MSVSCLDLYTGEAVGCVSVCLCKSPNAGRIVTNRRTVHSVDRESYESIISVKVQRRDEIIL